MEYVYDTILHSKMKSVVEDCTIDVINENTQITIVVEFL